jgi:hypothetical protein
MRRRFLLLPLLLGLALALPAPARATDPATARGAIASLEERLKAGLKVQAPADVAFCDRVIDAVRAGKFPGQVVDSTYLWAVRRGKKYPFPAFRVAILAKAERLGIRL